MPPRPAFQKSFSINAKPYALATRDGNSTWSSSLEPATPQDLVPQVLTFSFGPGGMGSSLPAVRNQNHYALGINHEGWDLIEPGPLHRKLGLDLDAPVVSLTTLRDNDAAGNWYLYAGGANVTVKIRLRDIGANPALGVVETKVHPAGSVLTQIVPVKDGPGITNRDGTVQPATCRAIILFGSTAQIRQINVVGVDVADTYQAVAGAAAYGGYAVPGPGDSSQSTRLWKTSPFTIAGNVGAFGALQGATISEAALNLTITSAWTPDPPYPVGDRGTPITSLLAFGGGVMPWKPEGGFTFDGVYSPQKVMSFASFRMDDNSRGSVAWGENVYIPTGQDIHQWPGRIPPTMGLSTVLSNLSPVRGRPTALAPFDRYLFVIYYDTSASLAHLVKLRHKELISSPHDYLFFPQEAIPDARPETMLVTADGGNSTEENIYLFYACASDTAGKFDVGYCVLAGPAYAYGTGGVLHTTNMGDPGKRMRAMRITPWGRNCDADNFYTITAAWDLATTGTAIGTGAVVNQNGRQTFDWTAGTSDEGNYLRLIIENTTEQPKTADPPQLIGASSDVDGAGGLQVYVLRQPDTVRRVRFVLNFDHALTYTGGGPKRERPQDELSEIEALMTPGTLANIVVYEHTGDHTARPYLIQSAKELLGADARGYDGAGRYVEVTAIEATLSPN
jgi:hypothetical protein